MKKILMSLSVGVGLLFLIGCAPSERQEGAEATMQEASGWPLLDGSGSSLELESLQGRVVLLDFWATWCPPCKKELPELSSMYTEMKDKGVTLVGMTVDQGSKEQVAAAVAPFKLSYPTVLAGEAVQKHFGGIRAVPTKFLLDQKGNVVEKYVGLVSVEKLKADIEKLLVK